MQKREKTLSQELPCHFSPQSFREKLLKILNNLNLFYGRGLHNQKKIEDIFLLLDVVALRYDDRELQIRLAELQADVQINLAICFGLLAILFTAFVGLQQIYFTSSDIVVKNSTFVSMLVCPFVMFFAISLYFNKVKDAREQMKELRKQYVW